MNDDAGAKLLAAVEALQAEVRALREEAREDREARDLLANRKSADAARQASLRERRKSQNSNVTSRDSNVTPGSLDIVVSSKATNQDQKIRKSRDNHAPSRDTGPAWEAFTAAYLGKYKVKPVRNATTNAQMAQVVKRLGEDAGGVAEFYVRHPLAWYSQKRHPVGLLLSDAEGLHTQWASGRTVTATEARTEEKTAANASGWAAMLKEKANGME